MNNSSQSRKTHQTRKTVQLLALSALSLGMLMLPQPKAAEAQVCNPFGCSQPGAGACNPFGCPNPGASECTPFGCPASPMSSSPPQNNYSAQRLLRVHNTTGYTLQAIYPSPSSAGDWGRNDLRSRLGDGYYTDFTLRGSECEFDIRAEGAGGGVYEEYQVDTCNSSDIFITYLD